MSRSESSLDLFISEEGRASLEKLVESILSSFPDAMIVANEHGTILAMGRAANEIFGYAPEECLGRNISMLMTRYDEERHDSYMDHYLETGERRIIGIGRLVKARLKSGDVIPVDLKIGEARIGDRRLFTGYIRDLSDQQQTEIRMREMQAELTHFSRLSTAGTMASAMAHELNQPLTAVTNYLEAARDLLDTPTPDTLDIVREALAEAAIHAVRTGKIVRKLRDYVSRGEIETRPVPLRPLLEDAISLAMLSSEDRSHTLVPRVGPGADLVDVDRIQIQQVVVNLVRNAIEATQHADVPLVRITAEEEGPDRVRVQIADNGHGFGGIEPSEVFRPFSSSKTGGMGLGLSICQTIIEAHGGEIRARENTPQGAIFEFILNKPLPIED